MENKCNKTPNNKFLDHVYCHNSEGKNHIRANNNNASGNAGGNSGGSVASGHDVVALLKENKQLKAMLILHLDLIQEQSDQLMAKDKVLNSVREENESVKTKNAQLEAQVQDLQKQLQRQMKRVVAGGGEVSKLPPPPLAKIQCKVEAESVPSMRATSEDVKCVKDEKATKEQQPEKTTKTAKKNYIIQDTTTTISSIDKPAGRKSANIIGECNGQLISKIILHRVNTSGLQSPLSTASDSASELEETPRRKTSSASKRIVDNSENGATGVEYVEEGEETEDSNDCTSTMSKRSKSVKNVPLKIARGAKPRKPLTTVANMATAKVTYTPSAPSRGGKQMPLMLTHAPELHSDESGSCDSIAETEQHTNCLSSPALSLSPKETSKHEDQSLITPPHAKSPLNQHVKSRRCGYISTTQRYCTRAWEDEEFNCDGLDGFLKDNLNALDSDSPPILEIPKWTEHEIPASYCIEGTEDLADETFLKRHAKLEVDEKRRKKWDVQQIREQRRIEKLKRRHCKDEIQAAPEPQAMHSFYPPPEAIQMIYYVNDLPVQAFGELIPKLSTNGDFVLPWVDSSNTSTSRGFRSVVTLATTNTGASSTQLAQQVLKSSFAFINKRRRQQSASNAPITRQRYHAKSQATVSTASTPAMAPLVTLTSAATINANPTELTSN